MSIHGDDELDEIDKEIKGLSEGAAENSKKTPQKGTTITINIFSLVVTADLQGWLLENTFFPHCFFFQENCGKPYVTLHGKTGKKVITRARYFNTLDKRKFL